MPVVRRPDILDRPRPESAPAGTSPRAGAVPAVGEAAGEIGVSVLGPDGWTAAQAPPWPDATTPSLCAHRDGLYAAFLRPSDGAVMWSTLEDTGWSAPEPLPTGDAVSAFRPALCAVRGDVWCLYVARDDSNVTVCPLPVGGQGLPFALDSWAAAAAPSAVPVGRGGLRTALRHPGGDAVIGDWKVRRGPLNRRWHCADQGWLTDGDSTGAIGLADHHGITWGVYRQKNDAIGALSWSADAFGPVWELEGPLTAHTPAVASHEGKLWLAYCEKDTHELLVCSAPDGRSWSPVEPVLRAPVAAAEPALVVHHGRLHAYYQREPAHRTSDDPVPAQSVRQPAPKAHRGPASARHLRAAGGS
ncbi:hypothetical protein ACF08N_27440 [Streptomyces sp. NPDC015127]|uniref:hypothetical protein n=1 Tax=Streptomyces sp. NPDC015127 TaxID=3364939 RepID=UPI0036F71289